MGKVRPKDLENGVARVEANRYYGTNSVGEVGFHIVPGAQENAGEVIQKYGQNISEGRLVFFGDGKYRDVAYQGFNAKEFYSTNSHLDGIMETNDVILGSTTNNLRYRVKFYKPNNQDRISSVEAPLSYSGSGRNVQCRIQNSRGDIIATSTNKISSTADKGIGIWWFSNFKLPDNEEFFYIEFINTTGADGSNYARLYRTYNSYFNTNSKDLRDGYEVFDGTSWVVSNRRNPIVLKINYSIMCESGTVYECNSYNLNTAFPDGITMESKVKGENGKVMVLGVNSKFEGLVAGNKYKLNSGSTGEYPFYGFLSNNITDVTDFSGSAQPYMENTAINVFDNAARQKLAIKFTCNFQEPISKINLSFMNPSPTTTGTVMSVKIVKANSDTGLPETEPVNANAITEVRYKDMGTFTNGQTTLLEFPAEFNLELNKDYYILFDIDSAINTTAYVKFYCRNATVQGKETYYFNGTDWTITPQTIYYSFTHIDDLGTFQKSNPFRTDNNARLLSLGYSVRREKFMFMVNKPRTVEAITFLANQVGTPTTNLKVRIEGDRIANYDWNTNGLRYDITKDGQGDIGGTHIGVFERFLPTMDIDIRRVSLPLYRTGNPTDKLVLDILEAQTDVERPDINKKVATTTIDVTGLGTSEKWVEFEFPETISLQKQKHYFLYLHKQGDLTDASNYYMWTNKSSGTFAGGKGGYRTTSGTWTGYTNNAIQKMSFDSSVYPTGARHTNNLRLVSEGAEGELKYNECYGTTSDTQYTVKFKNKFTLIPNTIYWVVFENGKPVQDTSNYYRILTAESDYTYYRDTVHTIKMPSVGSYNHADQTYDVYRGGYYPRFEFVSEDVDRGGSVRFISGEYSCKDVTALSATNGMLSFGDNGIAMTRTLVSTDKNFGYHFIAQKDGQIQIITGASYEIYEYVPQSNHYSKSTSYTTPTTYNIKAGTGYKIVTTSGICTFTLSFK